MAKPCTGTGSPRAQMIQVLKELKVWVESSIVYLESGLPMKDCEPRDLEDWRKRRDAYDFRIGPFLVKQEHGPFLVKQKHD